MANGTTAGARRPTIYDVADRANVSKSLVSLVLRRSPRVSPERRAAVLKAIAELDYQPSQAASMLAGARTGIIEVLIDEYRNLHFVGLVEGMREALVEEDFRLTVSEIQQPSMTSPIPWSTHVDGRILAAEPTAGLLANWGAGPTVVAGNRLSIPDGADVVASDDRAGSRLACEHLMHLGHRAIAHLTGSGGAAHVRRLGFEQTLRQAGLPAVVAGQDGGTAEQDGYAAAHEILSKHPGITAIMAANDLMASGAMAAARDLGLSVPGDLSVIGYDNSPLAQSRYMSMSTVDDRSHEVGRQAAVVLLSKLNTPGLPTPPPSITPTLIARGTTGPAPDGHSPAPGGLAS